LDAEVGSLAIGGGEFVVLVPFTRSPQQCSSVSVPSQEQGVNPPKQPEVSAAANSAWQDIMDDLSAMPSSPQPDIAAKIFTPHLARALGLGGLQMIRHRVKVHHLDLQGKGKRHARKMEMVPQRPFPLEKMVWLRSRSAA